MQPHPNHYGAARGSGGKSLVLIFPRRLSAAFGARKRPPKYASHDAANDPLPMAIPLPPKIKKITLREKGDFLRNAD